MLVDHECVSISSELPYCVRDQSVKNVPHKMVIICKSGEQMVIQEKINK